MHIKNAPLYYFQPSIFHKFKMKFELKLQDIVNQATSLIGFYNRFRIFFKTRTPTMAAEALNYFRGLLMVNREETMVEMESSTLCNPMINSLTLVDHRIGEEKN